MNECTFYFEEADRFYAGIDTGETWNGWPVVLADYATVDAICADYELEEDAAGEWREVQYEGRTLVYLDGFTPTVLDPEDLERAMAEGEEAA